MAAPTRGSLLRDINRMTTDIMGLTERSKGATSRLSQETATKGDLVSKIAKAEAEHTAVEKQKAAESANDSELVGLQSAVGKLTLKRQELVKATKAARGDRDAAKEEAAILLYQRSGLQVERAIAHHSRGGSGSFALSGSAVVWEAESLALLQDAEALWKKASNQSTTTRDVVDSALRSAGLRVTAPPVKAEGEGDREEGEGSGVSPTSACDSVHALMTRGESGVSSLLTGLGLPALLADANKGLAVLQDLAEGVASASARTGTLLTAVDTDVELEDDGRAAAVAAVQAVLAAVKVNALQQRVLLTAVAQYLVGLVGAPGEQERGGEGGA